MVYHQNVNTSKATSNLKSGQSINRLFGLSVCHSIYLSSFRSIYHCIVPLFYLSFCLPCMSVLLLHMLANVRRSQSPSSLVGESLTIFSFSLGKKVSDRRLMCSWGNDTSNRICHFKTSPNPCDLPYLPSEGSVWNAVSKANEEN